MMTIYHLGRFGILREGIKCLMTRDPDMIWIGEAATSAQLLHDLEKVQPGALLLDMDYDEETRRPLANCLELCHILQTQFPAIKVILHSPYRYATWLARFKGSGIAGIVSKNSCFQEILNAMEHIRRNEWFVCPLIAAQFSNYEAFQRDPSVRLKLHLPDFSERELEVLGLLSQGLSTKAIAQQLFRSEKTIESHRRRLIEKAQVKNTAELIGFVSVQGLVLQ